MQHCENPAPAVIQRTPWNKGKLIGAKPPLRAKHVWAIRTNLLAEGRTRDLAMFNLALGIEVDDAQTQILLKHKICLTM